MALRFLADHCVPKFVVESLKSEGHEVIRVNECLPVESIDSVVINTAQELGAVLDIPERGFRRHNFLSAGTLSRDSRITTEESSGNAAATHASSECVFSNEDRDRRDQRKIDHR